jgi:hypothetical protein
MKIVVTASGPELDSPVDPRYGRCGEHHSILEVFEVAREGKGGGSWQKQPRKIRS